MTSRKEPQFELVEFTLKEGELTTEQLRAEECLLHDIELEIQEKLTKSPGGEGL